MTTLMDKMNEGRTEAVKAGHAEKSSDWYKFMEGENRFRVMTIFEPIYEDFKNGICFTDCGFTGTPKYMCYVLDMREVNIDNQAEPKIKLAKLPAGIAEEIATLQQDEEWGFETFPAPYDIKVMAKNAGTKEVDYKVVASPKRTEVAEVYIRQLAEKKSILEIITKLKEKNAASKGVVTPSKQADNARLEEMAQGSSSVLPDYPENTYDEQPPF